MSPFRKRPSEKHKEAGTSEPPVTSTRKRKHPTLSSSPHNTDEDSVPSRRRRLATAIESASDSDRDGPSTAHASLPKREGRTTTEALPPHPPLEEIEMWVPTPNAKFGPPKRKRAAGERRHPPKGGPVDIAVPAKTSAQASRHPPSPPRHLILSESQIVALREEEEEESQSLPAESQPTWNRSGGPAQDTVPSDPLPSSAEDARGASGVLEGTPLVSLEQSIAQPSVDIPHTNPKANKVHVSQPHSQSVHPQPNSTNSSTQGSVTKAPKDPSPLPATTPHISLINLNLSTSATSSSKTPQPAKSSSPLTGKLGANTVKQLSSSRNEPSRRGSGTLAERRALEARIRLDELRRAGASIGSLAKWHSGALKTPQSPEQPPPHVILKQAMDSMESPDHSQIPAPRDPDNEMLGVASPSGHYRPDLSGGSKEDPIVQNKASQGTIVDLLPDQDDVVAMDVLVVRSDEAITLTALHCSQS
ncbi:hypothetical protein BJV74DRAFT_932930 [Russula compacta]|nr:hypothetical protein BJV74DRAFT_932930 [Russula compacta]